MKAKCVNKRAPEESYVIWRNYTMVSKTWKVVIQSVARNANRCSSGFNAI